MKFLKSLSSRMSVAGELLEFFWRSKWWWLTPMILVLLGFAVLIIFAQASPIAAFIYTLF